MNAGGFFYFFLFFFKKSFVIKKNLLYLYHKFKTMKKQFTTIHHKKTRLFTEQTNHLRFCSESFEVEWIENGKLKTKFFNTKEEVQNFLYQG